MSAQSRLIQTDGYAVLSGVEMLVKAGLASGVETFVGAQLDGPTAYADLLAEHTALLADKGASVLVQPDAQQAVAALQGAYLDGQAALAVVDALGVVDAAGLLLTEPRPLDETRQPGAAVLCYDGSDSSVGEAAGALLRRAGWVVMEPALQDEVLTFVAAGMEISRASGRPVALALPQSLMHGAATVACQPSKEPDRDRTVAAGDRSVDRAAPQAATLAAARSQRVNVAVNPSGKDEDLPLALITVGRSFGWARQAMAELGLAGRLPMLRLGVLAPLDAGLIKRHVHSCQQVLILDPTGLGIAESVRAAAGVSAAGDEGGADEPSAGPRAMTTIELEPDSGPGGVLRVLEPWLETDSTLPRELVNRGLSRLRQEPAPRAAEFVLSPRGQSPPPGSSLVDVSVVLGRLRRDLSDAQHMLEQHRASPVDLRIHGELDDTAELLLSRWQPLVGGLDCDGRLAGGAAAGAGGTQADALRSIVLMTSRRFFSLGVSAIADSVRAGRSVVYVIHTEDPAEAVGPKRRFRRRPRVNALDMQAVIEGVNAGRRAPTPSVTTIDPSDRPRMRRLLERLVLSDGVHVVIARRRRGPRYYRKAAEVHRRQSARRGYVAKQGCLVHCPEAGPLSPRRRLELGVLGVEPEGGKWLGTKGPSESQQGSELSPFAPLPLGPSAPSQWTTSVSWSWHDDTVMQALAEPAVGLAILERSNPERSRVVPQDLDGLPDPPKPSHANADSWRATLVGITGSAFDLTLQLMLQAGASMGYLVRSSASAEPTDGPEARRADVLFTRHEPVNAPHVPAAPGRASSPMLTAEPMPGKADLFIGAELTEAARLVAADVSPYDPQHTVALIDALTIPTIATLASGQDPDVRDLLGQIDAGLFARPTQTRVCILPIAHLAEWLWGHQRYAAWVYLGYLVQRGLIPLTIKAIESASQCALGMADPRASEAVRVGRKIAVDPAYIDRVLVTDEPDVATLARTLADDLALMAGSRGGTSLAGAFLAMIQPLLDRCADLPDALQRQIISTAQHCVFWAGAKNGPAYCQRYVDTLTHILAIDLPDRDYKLTRAAMVGLGQAMLIPDEVYLAALLTAPQRYRRDRQRFNISLEQGDKISYVHLLRPEFDLFKRRVAFTVRLGERAMKTLARFHTLRRIRPGWYRTQRDFRDLYLQTLADLPQAPKDSTYRHAIEIANVTTTIVGRGDVRRDSVQAARRKLEKLIAGGSTEHDA